MNVNCLLFIKKYNRINKKSLPDIHREGFLKNIKSDYLFHHKRVASLSAPPSFATPVARPGALV